MSTTTLPTTMKALVTQRNILIRLYNLFLNKSIGGRGGAVRSIPMPTITPDEILVRISAVALNPTDFKHLDAISPPSCILGCDYAGTVVAVGANYTGKWTVGDRVAGVVHGGLYEDRGSFAEYTKVAADLAWAVPNGVSDSEAAVYGVSFITAALSLHGRLGLPEMHKEKTTVEDDATIFIYAGATAAGLMAIQLAKLAGYTVVTTASPRSFDLVKKYGADAVFDYREETVSAQIVKEYPHISKAMDCFSEGRSSEICAEVIKNEGGKVVQLLENGECKVEGVEYDLVMAYTVGGYEFQFIAPIGPKFPVVPGDRERFARLYENLPDFTSTVKPPPITTLKGGFDDLWVGMDKLRNGEVVGGKLVVQF